MSSNSRNSADGSTIANRPSFPGYVQIAENTLESIVNHIDCNFTSVLNLVALEFKNVVGNSDVEYQTNLELQNRLVQIHQISLEKARCSVAARSRYHPISQD